MELTGKIIQALDVRSGVSQRTGTEWKVATYVLETLEQYPRKMAFEVFGSDKIQNMNIQVGETMAVSFDIDAHEYNGRWFNSIRAWKVDRNVAAAGGVQTAPADVTAPFGAAPQACPQPPFASAPQGAAAAPAQDPFGAAGNENENLPF